MQAATAGFKTAVEGVEYWVAEQITLTLPGGIYPDVTLAATSVEISAATTTDLPDQSRMQVGYPKITASFTLAGLVDQTDETKTAAWLFRKWNTASPLYQKDALHAAVTISIGLYPATAGGTPELIRKFTGFVDSYTVSPDGSVSFSCEDNHTLLRSLPDTPPVVTAPPYNAGLTSEYALDAVLRAATNGAISTWPAQRAQCILAAGFRASLWPEVGSLVTTTSQPIPTFKTGVFGSALAQPTPSITSLSNVTYSSTADVGTTVFIEFWTQGVFFSPFIGIHDAGSLIAGVPLLTCAVGPTGLSVTPNGSLGGPTASWSTTVNTGPHYVAFLLTLPAAGGTSWSVTMYLDGATHASGALTFGTARAVPAWNMFTAVPQTATIEALQVTTETAPVASYPFTPAVALDPSLNSLTAIPEVSGDPWQVIQQIADAELGVAGFDETGIFRFYNRDTIAAAPIARTVTSATSLANLEEESLAAAVINRGQVGFTAWNFNTVAAVWSLDSTWRIPKRSIGANKFVRYASVTDGSLFTNIDTTLTFMNDAGTTTAGQSYYRTSIDAAGTSDHPGVTIVLTQVTSGKVKIEITNATSKDCYLVASADHPAPAAGTPVLIIGGTPVTQSSESQADFQYPAASDGGAASTRFGEVAWQATGNPWIQDGDSASQLAKDVVLDGYVPRPNLTNISIIPDPRLQLTDVVHIVDPDTTGVDEYARIFGWTLSLSNGSWSMSIDARTIAPPGAWILGVAGRSELATTTYLQGV